MLKKTPTNIGFFINPIYWPVWFLLGIFWLIAQLPYRTQLFLGKYFGLLIYIFSRKAKKTATININLCFPELSNPEKEKLIKKFFISLGTSIFESFFAWFASEKRIKNLAHIEREKDLNEAIKLGKGMIFMGAHFTTLEIVGRLFALRYDFAVVYRKHKIPFINFLIQKLMTKYYGKAIERSNVRGIVKALKNGEIVWYTPDIDAGYFSNVFAPFFGVPASSLTATVKFIELTGALLVPIAFYRRDNGTGYDMTGLDPIETIPSGNIEKDIALVNKIQENLIRKKPEQYLWTYKRFKTRPKGEARFY